MKQTILPILLILLLTKATSQTRLPEYDNYIDTYRQFAIDSRERFGIPAAITMAQGILESAAGTSNLATECNNHFGIKCGSSWYGKTMTKDDDSASECFRCYTSAQASFDDHSEFLKRQRYSFLFDYAVTDYGSWAQGLRQAGYATDPAYPQKLIAIIENYELYLLDGGKNLNLTARPQSTPRDSVVSNDTTDSTFVVADNKPASDQSRTAVGTATVTAATTAATTVSRPKSTRNNAGDSLLVDKTATYTISENNGVRCIQLTGDATFRRISKLTNISVERLLYLNDLPEAIPLHAGDYVYLSWKKSQADRSLPDYTVKTGDSMFSIAQQFGIRLSSLYKLNNMPYGTPARAGQQLKLHH